MSYRKKVVGLARRIQEFVTIKSAKAHRYSEEVTGTFAYRVSYGWRLECGHVMDGQRAHGKKSMNCYMCEWVDEGTHARLADQSGQGWEDLPNEAERLKAQP